MMFQENNQYENDVSLVIFVSEIPSQQFTVWSTIEVDS